MANGDTKTESYLRAAAEGTRADLPSDTCCNTKTQNLILGVANRIMDVEDEVEELKNNPDVVDIVDTYADLQAYDTQHLTENDIIRVLQDETHDNNSTYYRFTKNPDTWTFIGEISGGSSVNVVQTTGTSTTDVMSQNATTSMVFADPNTKTQVRIGSINVGGTYSVRVGYSGSAGGNSAVSIGANSGASAFSSVAIGPGVTANKRNSVGLGSYATTTREGEVNIGTGTDNHGYNSTSYRVLGGVHDPVDAHDAATKGYVDANAGGPTVVQTTGASTTKVMSQNAVTDMIVPRSSDDALWINNPKGANTIPTTLAAYSVTINPSTGATGGAGATATSAIAINGTASGHSAVAIGVNTTATQRGAIALGRGASATSVGEMNIGTNDTTAGYNNTAYRLLTGVHDGQNAHDAVTVSQVNSVIDAINTALSTNIPHIGA